MKSFKEYREQKPTEPKKEHRYPSMETSFGQHSLDKKSIPNKEHRYPSMETSFGQHSRDKVVNEEIDPNDLSNDYHRDIHLQRAPMHTDKMTPEEIDAVKKYTDDSKDLNRSLHSIYNGANKVEIHNYDDNVDRAKMIDTALDKHQTHDDFHVYTGVRRSPSRYFEKDASGNLKPTIVHLPAFTSASSSKLNAEGFTKMVSHENDENHGITERTNHILKIHVPKGSKAASVAALSWLPTEKEILLHRGYNIEVDPHPTKETSGIVKSEPLHVWHARIIEHKPTNLE